MEDRRWQKPIVGNLRHLTAIWKAGVKVVFIRACASIFMEWGAKIVLYLVSHGGTSMVDAGGGNFIFGSVGLKKMYSWTRFQRILFLCHKCFLLARATGGRHGPSTEKWAMPSPRCAGHVYISRFDVLSKQSPAVHFCQPILNDDDYDHHIQPCGTCFSYKKSVFDPALSGTSLFSCDFSIKSFLGLSKQKFLSCDVMRMCNKGQWEKAGCTPAKIMALSQYHKINILIKKSICLNCRVPK